MPVGTTVRSNESSSESEAQLVSMNKTITIGTYLGCGELELRHSLTYFAV
jgi:hypothetical protein